MGWQESPTMGWQESPNEENDGPIEEIGEYTFIYGREMSRHNRRSKEKFVEYVGNHCTYSCSAKRSLEEGRFILAGVSNQT